jgi:hypothetical protein
MQLGAFPVSVQDLYPRHQWRQFDPSKASRMFEELTDRPSLGLACPQSRRIHRRNCPECARSLKSIAFPEIYPNVGFVASGLSSFLRCSAQKTVDPVLANNHLVSLSNPSALSLHPKVLQMLRPMLNLPSTCLENRHRHRRRCRRMLSRPLLDRHHEYL